MIRRLIAALCLVACAALTLRADITSDIQGVSDTVEGSFVFNVAPTGSMEPTFGFHHWILVKRLPFKDIRLGEVIVYQSAISWGDQVAPMICHRVIGRSSGGSVLICKGDSNTSSDRELIAESMYVGTIVAVVQKPH